MIAPLAKPTANPISATPAIALPPITNPNHIDPRHWQEWINSGVSHEIIAANVVSLDGDSVYDPICISPNLERRNDGRLTSYWLNRYAHCTEGMWWCSGLEFYQDDQGNWQQRPMEWGCGKPNKPRIDPQTGKPIKYEHPAKTPTRAFFLESPSNPRLWLECLANPNTPIIIVEGAKKAGCLLTLGFVAIALPGIFNGYRSKDADGNPVEPELIADLKPFATPGRQVYICFDHDRKPKTVANVNKAIAQLGRLFTRAGCRVKVIALPGPEKGVDDFVAGHGPEAFERLYVAALPYEVWKVRQSTRLTYEATHVNQRYLNLSIPDRGFVVIESPMDTGKTHQLKTILGTGDRVLVINNLVALTWQLANRLGLAHYQDGSPQGKSRLVISVDSLYKLLNCQPFDIVVLDEVAQALDHLLNSSTCSEMRERIQVSLGHIVRTARLVVIQEARVPDWVVDYVKALRGEEPICYVNDYRSEPRQIRWLNAPNSTAAIAEIEAKLKGGQKILIATNSKQKVKSLERKFSQIPGLNIRAIHGDNSQDRENQEFLANINQRLSEVDCLIYSPSVRAGLSLDTPHFDEVYGLFEAGSVPAWELEQQLFRNRPAVPITVWCVRRGQGVIRSTYWRELLEQELTTNKRSGILLEVDTKSGTIGGPHLEAWGKVNALKNLSLLHQAATLKGLLLDAGHNIIEVGASPDQPTQESMKEIRQEIRREEAITISNAPDLTEFDVERLRFKDSLSEEERRSLDKFHLQKATRQDITPELVELHQDFNLIGCILTREGMENPELARERDLEEIDKLKFSPDRRHHYQSAVLLGKLLNPILNLEEWTNDGLQDWRETMIDPYHRAIADLLNLTINPKASNTKIAGELLAKAGYFTHSSRLRDEETGKMLPRVYSLDLTHPVHQIVTEAIARRTAARSTPPLDSVSKSDTNLIHTPPLNNQNQGYGSDPQESPCPPPPGWQPGQRVLAWVGGLQGWCGGVLRSVERLCHGGIKAIVALDGGVQNFHIFDESSLAQEGIS